MRRPPPVGGEKVRERDKRGKRSSDDVDVDVSEKAIDAIESKIKKDLSLSSPISSILLPALSTHRALP
jgi:hypothetical protein